MTGPSGMAAFHRDQRGAALIEFAFLLPFLALLFVGGYQISDAVFVHRKVTMTARTLADVTSQYTTVSTSDLDTILGSAQQVLSPYAMANAEMVVSQVVIDASGNATVAWSRGLNVAARAPGSSFYVPSAYRQNGATVIVADVTYRYRPTFASSYIGPLALTEQVTMYPRKSSSITKT
ncbi:pilus assembly protein [Sphingomonas sp. A2-49]|uniref:TadE/TadG family type IV pilus assembly protein n=1 Tax=Sphingomonas sp. A2-49 TaxID=1391375 RepID=UPI0021D2FD5A|nr:TadE/TadG family type IV pilus assembly protein [Sphingomonas sp. A2-49]MCU6452714.1 pilus assembly protein [Sphingomonas sp. A2-49]